MEIFITIILFLIIYPLIISFIFLALLLLCNFSYSIENTIEAIFIITILISCISMLTYLSLGIYSYNFNPEMYKNYFINPNDRMLLFLPIGNMLTSIIM